MQPEVGLLRMWSHLQSRHVSQEIPQNTGTRSVAARLVLTLDDYRRKATVHMWHLIRTKVDGVDGHFASPLAKMLATLGVR